MTSRADSDGQQGGFTLIEVLAVVAVLGLALGVVALRGPSRSARLDLLATAEQLASGLRDARGRAIAGNRPVRVVIEAAAHRWTGADGRTHAIPPQVGLVLAGLAGPVSAPAMAILFAPDGSSTGGSVMFVLSGRQAKVAASWLSGRVHVDAS
jgi:general secretion pathway protein H